MRLLDLLEPAYRTSDEVAAMQEALQPYVAASHTRREDFIAQLNVTTATWGLDYWEQALGVETELSKPLSFRRARVMAKLRGRGTTTVEQIRSIASSYSDLNVEVREYPAEYLLLIRFLGALGVPVNLAELGKTLGEILPAHIAYELAFAYQAGTIDHFCGFFLHRGRHTEIMMEPF